ncbi:Protein yellow [Orchesella cincta]|uniref:Protein yellow n=1 Tax=Orchesella cincta TaxID=48709 RepID=A0A1D2MGP7_ORCCI|nr:Protein yellow [Orchesella cincta]
MNLPKVKTLFLTLIWFVAFLTVESSSYEVILSWKQLDYDFPTLEARNKLINSQAFIPENNIIAGVKVYENRVFLTVPRWREGEIGSCSSLQYVQSMTYDLFGRMWVIDVGRVNIFTEPDNHCPPKLLLIDMETDEVIKLYEFPDSVVSHTTNFLNDIVVSCEERKEDCFAYITDAMDAKLIVYNLREDKSWFVHHETMMADDEASIIPILGQNYTFKVNIDGIALSPLDANFERVYYRPLSSYELYSVSTSVLKQASNGVSLEHSQVISHGSTSSQSDGLTMDSQGFLYYGLLANNSVGYFNTTSARSVENAEVVLVKNDIVFQWVDTFAFDNKGYLYMTTNRVHRFEAKTLNFSEENFRAGVFIGNKSYMYSDF